MNRYRIVAFLCAALWAMLCNGSASAQNDNPAAWSSGSFSAPFAGQFGFQPGLSGGGAPAAVPPVWSADPAQMPATGYSSSLGVSITSNKALDIVGRYLEKTNNDDLHTARLYEYNTHFEVELKEDEGLRGAFELIIDKFSGRIYPETGANVLWNNKYGINGNYFGLQPVPTISVGEALQRVGDFIKRTSPDLKVEGDVTDYYGYYEFHVTQEGKLAIEVNINGFTGQMWIENWHGSLLREVPVKGRN